MIRPGTVLWLLLVIAVGYAMFQVKYEVMQQEETLGRLNKEIADSREQIRMVDAEWSYLTRPDRLRRLATRYLNLTPIAAAQIAALNTVPERPDAPAALVLKPNAAAPAQPTTIRSLPQLGIAPRLAAAGKTHEP
jgi:cell division protein FtsL